MIIGPATVLSSVTFSLEVVTTPYTVPTTSDGMLTFLSSEIGTKIVVSPVKRAKYSFFPELESYES